MSSRWPRRWAIIAAASLLLALVGPISMSRSATAQSGGSVDPVDLPALVPGVLDLEDADLDGFVPSNTLEYDTLESYISAQGLEDVEASLTMFSDLEDAGFVRQFTTWWSPEEAVLANRDGERWNPLTQIRFYATQFGDDDGAVAGLVALAGDAAVIDDADDFGDGSIFSDSPASYDDLSFDGVDALVRVGALVLGVTVRAQEDSPDHGDELDLATDLIAEYVDRVEALDELPTDSIGLATVRFTGPSLYTNRNSYLIRDGASVWSYTEESTAEREALTEDLVATGVVSQYHVLQFLLTEELQDEAFNYIVESRVTAYESERTARDAFDDIIPIQEDFGSTIEELDDAPEIGDESVAFEALSADESDHASFMAWRDGTIVYRLDLDLPTRFADPEALFAFAGAQADCLDADDCATFRELPDAVLDDAGDLVGEDPRATIPEENATPEPNADAATYEGVDFDFTLSWDADVWTRDDDYEPLVGAEGLRLDRADGGSLFIDVIDDRSGRTVTDCLDDISDRVLGEDGVDDVEAARDEDGDEIAGDTDDYAFAAWTVTFEEEPGLDYVGCATLEDGESAVTFIYISADVDDIDAQIADIDDLVEGYQAG